jgi:hypothetical protein
MMTEAERVWERVKDQHVRDRAADARAGLRIVENRQRVHVPMMVMDSTRRDIAGDQNASDAMREAAHHDYVDRLQSAWAGDKVTLIVEPDRDPEERKWRRATYPLSTRSPPPGGRADPAPAAGDRSAIDEAWEQMRVRLENAWRVKG